MKSEEKHSEKIRLNNRDYSISFVRFIAICCIVTCHIMQRDNFSSVVFGATVKWASWFNVGVQMFLFISGYLYGKKEKLEIVEFYKKGFPKILADYYIFIFLMLVLIRLTPVMSVDKGGVVRLLTFSGTIPGLGHLWFIPTILFCYFLAPVFLR